MSIKSIIIDKQTKAERISPDKIRLDLVAMPLDEENNTEPLVGLRIYVNDQILENFEITSDHNGVIKETLTIDDNGDSESILVKLKELKGEVESKLKCVMVEKKELVIVKEVSNKVEQPNKAQGLYNLNKDVLGKFKAVDKYFQELFKPENGHEMAHINYEFNKINSLVQLKFNLEKAKKLEFYEKYKKDIDDIQDYCFNHMMAHEIDLYLQEITKIIKAHDDNVSLFRKEKEESQKPEPKKEEPRVLSNREKEYIIAQIKLNPNYVRNADELAQNDKEIVKYALEQDGLLLQYLGYVVKEDQETVKIALIQNPKAFSFVSDFLKTDENFVIDCLNKYGMVIVNYLSNYIKEKDAVKTAIDRLIKEHNQQKEELSNLINQRDILNKKQQELISFAGVIEELERIKTYYEKILINIDYIINNFCPKIFSLVQSKKHNEEKINEIETKLNSGFFYGLFGNPNEAKPYIDQREGNLQELKKIGNDIEKLKLPDNVGNMANIYCGEPYYSEFLKKNRIEYEKLLNLEKQKLQENISQKDVLSGEIGDNYEGRINDLNRQIEELSLKLHNYGQ